MRVHKPKCLRQSRRRWIVRNVPELVVVIHQVADPVLVIAVLPNLLRLKFAYREGISAFDQLNALWERLIVCRGKEYVDVVRHNNEAVYQEFALLSIPHQRCEKQLGVGLDLKVLVL